MENPINSISFGKSGKVQLNKDEGVQKSAFGDSKISSSIFKKYDTDNNGILDSSELKQLENDLSDYAGNNHRLGKREAKKFAQSFGYTSDNARSDIHEFLSQIGSSKDNIESAITKNGQTTVKYNPDENGQLTEQYQNIDRKSVLDTQIYENKKNNSTLITKYENGEITGKTLKQGAITTETDANDKPLKRTVDKGNGNIETTVYTYDDKTGNVTETTTDAEGNVISVKVKDKDGNEIPQEQQPEIEEQKPEKEFSTYTVQNGEGFKGLIKRSLQAQGIENPTKEQMDEAIEEFKQNNPGAVKTAKNGNEYLLVGAKVKIAGGLEDKDNSEEQINKYKAALPKRRPSGGSHGPKNGKVVSKTGRYTITKNGVTKYYAADGTQLKQSYFEAVEAKDGQKIKSKNGSGRYYVKTSNGETWYFAANGKAIKKNYYNNVETQYNAVKAQKARLANAKKAFKQQVDSDGWAGKTADAVSALWNSDNRAVKVEADLKKYENELKQLQQAQAKGPAEFNKKFKEIYGVNYNANNVLAYEQNPTEENYKKAYGTKNNIHKRVMVYNKSQQDGAAAVKTTVVVAASAAAAVATGGASVVATAAIAGASTAAARATVEITDLATNNIDGDINAETLNNIAEQAVTEGVIAGVTAGTVKGVGNALTSRAVSSGASSATAETGLTTVSRSAASAETGLSTVSRTAASAETGLSTVSRTAASAETGLSTVSRTAASAETGLSTVSRTAASTETGLSTTIAKTTSGAGSASARTAANAGAKASANAGAKAGANAGTRAGANAGARASANAGAKAGANAGTKAGANAGTKAGANAGTSTAAGSSAQNLQHITNLSNKVASRGGIANLSAIERNELSQIIGKPIESISKMPKSELRQLLLKFHPDKNVGNEEFCKQIFNIINNLK